MNTCIHPDNPSYIGVPGLTKICELCTRACHTIPYAALICIGAVASSCVVYWLQVAGGVTDLLCPGSEVILAHMCGAAL